MGEDAAPKKSSLDDKEALSHAWNWFTLHASQRMQCVNYFLLAMAFMTTAYVTSFISSHYWAAFCVALLASWFSLCFNRLEHRTKTLVKAGEAALAPLQAKLSSMTGVASLNILKSVEVTPFFGSYSKVINALQWTSLGAFGVGAILALLKAVGPEIPGK